MYINNMTSNNIGENNMGIIMAPSENYIDFPLPASGGTWTAPDYGFVNVRKTATGPQYIQLSTLSPPAGVSLNVSKSSGEDAALLYPVSKNDVIRFTYTTAGKTNLCRFIYAVGTNP